MYKIIFSYLTGIVLTIFFNLDMFSILFFISIVFFIYHFSSGNNFHGFKGQVKDTRKFIKDIGFLVIISGFFLLGNLYTKSQLATVSYKHVTHDLYDLSGTVEQVKQQNNSLLLTTRVEKFVNSHTSLPQTSFPKYVEIPVSPTNKFSMYDRVNVTGEVGLKNWQDYYEEKPMFFSYEFMKLGDTANYNVSNIKNISKLPHAKSFSETANSAFHATSENLKARIPQHMSEPYAAIAQGISTGEQENLQKDIKDIFKKSGLIHILVLSGANVTFIISLLWFFLQRFKNRLLKTISAIFLSWTFIFMTGITAPSVRAGVMSSSNIFAEYFAKNIGAGYSLLFALFILCLVSPLTLVYSPSLHLSFLACFGLFVVAPKLEKYLSFKNKFVRIFVATFLGIFIFVTPYLLGMSGEASLFGTALTFLVEPLVMLSTVLSFLIILFSFVSIHLADIFGILNTFCTKIILQVAEFGANNLPLIHFQIAPTFLLAYYSVLILVFTKWYNLDSSKKREYKN